MKTPTTRTFEIDWYNLRRSAPKWFRDAKFGLFFHWGPYCVPAFENEWYSRNMYNKGLSQHKYHTEHYGKLDKFGYKDFYKNFTGEYFDSQAWAELMVVSGAKYGGIVTEHADNFSMWNSRINSVNAVNYGPKRDVVGLLEKAIKKQGLKFITTFHHQWLWGWFMSTDPNADVYHPDNEMFYGKALPLETNRYIPWRLPDNAFNHVWMQKVREVIQLYDPDLIYFDSRANIIDERFKYELIDYYYNGSNSRVDRIISYKQTDFPHGVGIEDVECGRFSDIKSPAWQTDDRLEDKRTWCYVQNPKYKPAKVIIHQLCDIVSKNGNLLLNVGPKADGTFAEQAVSVLKEIGNWLSQYGEAIYGTRPFKVYGEGFTEIDDSSFDIADIKTQTTKGVFTEKTDDELTAVDIRFTTKDNILYAIFMGKPDCEQVRIKSLAKGSGLVTGEIERIDILNGADNLEWDCDAQGLKIMLKGLMPSQYANVIKISFVR